MSTNDTDILFRREGALGRVTLNRPKTLNALTLSMCNAMRGQLAEWADAPDVRVVVIDAVPGRAFCAGGDIRAVWEWGRAGDSRAAEFFAAEYGVDGTVAHFPKPYIALCDGLVMGGGAGIAVHGSHCIVTENTLFAMPEAAIGFFPDVGSSYFLPRCPGAIGMYLGLTGARVDAADMIYAGLATHFVPAARLDALRQRLADGAAPDTALASLQETSPESTLARNHAAIDRVFSHNSVDAVAKALAEEGDWGAEVSRKLAASSPTSLEVAFRLLRDGTCSSDIDVCLRTEYGLARAFLRGHDFYEGIRAAVIDKDRQPKWQPATRADVTDSVIAAYFDAPDSPVFPPK